MESEKCKDCILYKEIKKRVYDLENPKIENSVGAPIRVCRETFDQKNYEKPTEKHVMELIQEALKKLPSKWRGTTRDLIKDILLIITFLTVIISHITK